MGIIHRFRGGEQGWNWEGVEKKTYPDSSDPGGPRGVSVRWLVGRQEGAPYFAVRYYEVEPGGQTIYDQHTHDHGVIILRGKGKVRLGERMHDVSFGDVVYIPPNEVHQFENSGNETFAFLCVIGNKEFLKSAGVI